MEEKVIFKSKLDAVFYIFVYLVFPIIGISTMILQQSTDVNFSVYLSITVSIISNLYDCFSRWQSKNKCRKNNKIFFPYIKRKHYFDYICLLEL